MRAVATTSAQAALALALSQREKGRRIVPCSQPPTPAPRAFTIIELLVVISIITILMGVVVGTMSSDRDDRRIREAARAVNLYLGSARVRAMETGRPCGVILRNFAAPGFAMNADQCEVPPNYCGECYSSVAEVRALNQTTVLAELTDGSGNAEPIPLGIVKRSDLMQLNLQGPYYTVNALAADPDPSTGSTSTLYLRPLENILVPWPTTDSKTVPYRIIRSPIKGFAQPLQLPAGTVVDIAGSGVGNSAWGTGMTNDATIMFSPNGSVESIYIGGNKQAIVEPIYLLIGKRERVDNVYTDPNTNEAALTNLQDMGNLWVTINPHSGAVQTEPVASCAGVADWNDAIVAARELARQGLGMGGR